MDIISPQPGFQTDFLSTPADIAIGGGSAGAGKTFALLMEAARNRDVPDFGAVIFRRTFPEIKQEGGIWDECFNLFPYFNAVPNLSGPHWDFPAGARVSFKHLQHEKDLLSHQGGQYALIGFDEITHFTKKMFLYLLSRNRSMCGVRPYIRATCNPDPDSFVAELIEWWIDQETGFPIPERCGKLRYMIVDGDNYVWGDTPQEVIDRCPHIFNSPKLRDLNPMDLVKSVTFIPGDIHGNTALLAKDPSYLANLLSQDEETKRRLYLGNWKISNDELSLFQYQRIADIFSNVVPPVFREQHFITVDHARFGRDLCVIGAWIGWRCVEMRVLTKSDTNQILAEVRALRIKYRPIPASNIIADQDAIGVIDALSCLTFFGSAQPFKEHAHVPPGQRKPDGKKVEPKYDNRKVQCYFRLSDHVNTGDIWVDCENVYVDGQKAGTVKIKGKTHEIKSLIRDDLRVIKRLNPDSDGKIKITPKEEQKNVLAGRSPDFGDMFMLRAYFDLAPTVRHPKTS